MKQLPTLSLPKAAPVALVAESDAQRFERSEESGSGKAAKGNSRLKRDKLGERVTVYLPPKLATAIRRRCLNERRSISDGITEAAEAWINTSKRSLVNE